MEISSPIFSSLFVDVYRLLMSSRAEAKKGVYDIVT